MTRIFHTNCRIMWMIRQCDAVGAAYCGVAYCHGLVGPKFRDVGRKKERLFTLWWKEFKLCLRVAIWASVMQFRTNLSSNPYSEKHKYCPSCRIVSGPGAFCAPSHFKNVTCDSPPIFQISLCLSVSTQANKLYLDSLVLVTVLIRPCSCRYKDWFFGRSDMLDLWFCVGCRRSRKAYYLHIYYTNPSNCGNCHSRNFKNSYALKIAAAGASRRS